MFIHGVKRCKLGNTIRILDNRNNLCFYYDIPLEGKLVAILRAGESPDAKDMEKYLGKSSLYPKTRPFKKGRIIVELTQGGYFLTPVPLNSHKIESIPKTRRKRKNENSTI